MDNKIESFINNVTDGLVVDDKLKKRIAQDLRLHITEASINQSIDAVLNKMGNPAEVAGDSWIPFMRIKTML